jgi:hypothetical protein
VGEPKLEGSLSYISRLCLKNNKKAKLQEQETDEWF